MSLIGLLKQIDFLHTVTDFLNNLNDAVFLYDLDLKILWANKVAVEKSNLPLVEIQGQYCYKLYLNKDQPCSHCPLLKTIKTGQIQEAKIKNDRDETLFIRSIPVKNKKGELIALADITMDLSQYAIIEEKLEETQKRLASYNNISHELKTPLNLILSATRLLENRVSDEKNIKYIKTVQHNYYRLLRLVNNILDLTKIESGYYKLNVQNYDIVKNITELAVSIEDYIVAGGRNFEYQLEIIEKVMAYDTVSLERIILNLISNAVKFTESGDKIILNLQETDGCLVISVQDTGIGIPLEKQKTIFERYTQVQKGHQGCGLGLSIVKSLVEMHEGEIDLESRPGTGSKFSIRLPVDLVAEESALPVIDIGMDMINLEFSEIPQPVTTKPLKNSSQATFSRKTLFD